MLTVLIPISFFSVAHGGVWETNKSCQGLHNFCLLGSRKSVMFAAFMSLVCRVLAVLKTISAFSIFDRPLRNAKSNSATRGQTRCFLLSLIDFLPPVKLRWAIMCKQDFVHKPLWFLSVCFVQRRKLNERPLEIARISKSKSVHGCRASKFAASFSHNEPHNSGKSALHGIVDICA